MGAVTKHRDGMLAERSQDELAHLALGNGLVGFRVYDLPEKMIFGDMLHVALGEAFPRNPGTHGLGQTVVVGAYDMHATFDLRLQSGRTRLAAEQADAKRALLPIEAHLLADLAYMQCIRRR